MYSSYCETGFGALLEALVCIHKPSLCVELGCLEGYSATHLARGLKKNRAGRLVVVDLFEAYPYRNCPKAEVQNNLRKELVDDYVELVQDDVFSRIPLFPDDSIDLLHIDLSNNGDLLEQVFSAIDAKLKKSALIIFEGGSAERDGIKWMKDFNKKPLGDFIGSRYFQESFNHVVLTPFPSMTICQKKASPVP
jgi:predicted O-methyltransferase YrrM